MRYKILVLSTLVVLLSGCTKTTHFLTVTPTNPLPTDELTNRHKIEVTTNSQISDKIGSIDTVLKKHADLVLANNLEERVNTKVIQGLRSLGFNLEQGQEPPATLNIQITKLKYATEVQTVNTVATIQFSMRATLTANNKVYKGNYKSEITDEYTVLPSRASVEEVISKITGQTINRLLNDPNIRILLQR